MTMSSNALSDALTDVRKAYRLVHAYQRRLWDLLEIVDSKLALAGLAFWQWHPMNFLAPPRPSTRFFTERWAWDFIPAYEIGCQWQEAPQKGQLLHRVFLIAAADTGYDAICEGEPDPAAFLPAETCVTEIRVGLWTSATATPRWNDAWERIAQLSDPHDGKSHRVEVEGVPYTYRYFVVDLAQLADAEAIQAKLLAPIEAWLGEKET